jgi:hypothetical protein
MWIKEKVSDNIMNTATDLSQIKGMYMKEKGYTMNMIYNWDLVLED